MKEKLKRIKSIKYKDRVFVVNDELIDNMLLILTSEDKKLLEEALKCEEV